ncbi:MAG: hypothetical protein WAM30_10175 [Candidatus Dormiibacterota bacterium]
MPDRACLLLLLYPRRWRERYGAELLDVLRSRQFNAAAGFDVVRGALDAWRRGADGRLRLGWAAVLAATMLVGWMSAHATDDVQAVAVVLLFGSMVAGALRLGRCWLPALVLFSAVPLSSLWTTVAAARAGRPHPIYQTAVALVPVALGALIGVAGRVLLDRLRRTPA